MVEEFIIQGIKNKYEIEYKTTKVLNDAEEMVLNYFNELDIYIKHIKETLNEKIRLKVKDGDIIAELKMDEEYITFKREKNNIKVYMSNCSKEGKLFAVIESSKDFQVCVHSGNFTFGYGDINEMLRIAFDIERMK